MIVFLMYNGMINELDVKGKLLWGKLLQSDTELAVTAEIHLLCLSLCCVS